MTIWVALAALAGFTVSAALGFLTLRRERRRARGNGTIPPFATQAAWEATKAARKRRKPRRRK